MPKIYPVSSSQTTNNDIAAINEENILTLSLRTLSCSVLRILSTPGYASLDFKPPILNCSLCLADILAKIDERWGGIKRKKFIENIAIANSNEEYSQLVRITPADEGAAIENQKRIEGVYLIVDTHVQNLLCESILSTLFEKALSSPEIDSA